MSLTRWSCLRPENRLNIVDRENFEGNIYISAITVTARCHYRETPRFLASSVIFLNIMTIRNKSRSYVAIILITRPYVLNIVSEDTNIEALISR